MAIDTELTQKRNAIDAFDTEILHLLVKRTQVVESVALLKKQSGTTAYMRQGREAQIIRRLLSLLEAENSTMQPDVIFRLWREIMMASLQIECPFKVAVFAPAQEQLYRDLARDHFGGSTPCLFFETTGQVIRAVGDGTALLGVLPDMSDDKIATPWWRHLLSADNNRTPRFVFKLPFLNTPHTTASSYVIGRVPFEPSGDDRSFIGLEGSANLSRPRLKSILQEAGFSSGEIAVWKDADLPEIRYFLVEIHEYLAPDEPRLEKLKEAASKEIKFVYHLGGYATPIMLDALKEESAA